MTRTTLTSGTLRGLPHPFLIAAAIFLGAVAPAAAVDGVVEINQACADVGCLPGDGPGLPVTITSPGSYRLTGPLTTVNQVSPAVSIDADDVEFDLNGFGVFGPVVCSDEPTGQGDCTPSSSNEGIQVNGARVLIHGGTVRGFGHGVRAFAGSVRLSDLFLHSNRINGAMFTSSGGGGSLSSHGVVTNVEARSNGGSGIGASSAAVVRDSTLIDNGEYGFAGGAGCVVVGNHVVGNDSFGIFASSQSRVVDNTILENAVGVQAGSGSIITGNTIRDNTGSAITTGQSGVAGNVLTNNGSKITGGIEIGTNLCNGSTSGCIEAP